MVSQRLVDKYLEKVALFVILSKAKNLMFFSNQKIKEDILRAKALRMTKIVKAC